MQSLCSFIPAEHSGVGTCGHWHGDSYLSPFREITSCAPSEIFEHTLQCEHLGQKSTSPSPLFQHWDLRKHTKTSAIVLWENIQRSPLIIRLWTAKHMRDTNACGRCPFQKETQNYTQGNTHHAHLHRLKIIKNNAEHEQSFTVYMKFQQAEFQQLSAS